MYMGRACGASDGLGRQPDLEQLARAGVALGPIRLGRVNEPEILGKPLCDPMGAVGIDGAGDLAQKRLLP
jgi:hypothetical protein